MKRNTICKICAALLSIVMTLGFAGCVKTPSDVPDTTTTSAPVAVTTEGDSSPVEPADYENYQFKVLERELASGTSIYYEAFTDTESTDIINTALVKRNRLVEDRNKIKIVSTVIPNTSMKSAISTMVSSGDDLYDVIFGYGGYTMYFAINNYVRDMNTFEDIDFNREWWYTSTMEESKIAGKNAFAVGDICTASYTATCCIFYNKTLGAKYNVENCYRLVLDDKWTYEKFKTVGLAVTADLDGNGMDANDQYTLAAANWAYQPYFYGQGYNLLVTDSDGNPAIGNLGETEVNILEDIIELCNADTTWYLTKYQGSGMGTADVFESGRCLFWAQLMVGANKLRNMSMDFGILPLPKRDESQEKYISYLHTKTSLLSVPVTNSKDDDRTGHIIEDMAYHSWKVIRPQYFEVLFDGIIARDSETTQMLDIIYDNVFLDLVQPLGGVGLTINNAIRGLIDTNSKSIASTWKSNMSQNQKILEQVIKKYETLP